jgi:cytochrome c oxidase accessory protein FixG
MREQVCIYMCPWPRIQSAMLDEKSLTVTYKEWRGEPRHRGTKKATLADLKLGDCIDCNRCVAVCPTGIDIREGPQVGCITCALCIDACDKVMESVGRPRGLIDYTTFENATLERRGEAPKPIVKEVFRPRTIVYFGLWASIGLVMLFGLGARTRIDISAQQDRNPIFVRLSDGAIRNGYVVKIRNMEARPREVAVTLEGLPGAVMWTETGSRASAVRELRTTVPADELAKLRIFVAAPGGSVARQDVTFSVRALDAEAGGDSVVAQFERPAA